MNNKDIKNHLIQRDVQLQLLQRKNWKDSTVLLEAESAICDMLIRVRQSKGKDEHKSIWLDDIEKVSNLANLTREFKEEIALLELQYGNLYKEYSRLVDTVTKLKEEF